MPRRSVSRERESPSDLELPHDAQTLDPDQDYFMKQAEFRVWLREEKGKYVDELSGEKSRAYFRKFVKRWNSGKLDDSFYSGRVTARAASSSNTAYRWSFAGKESKKDKVALEEARDTVARATNQVQSTDGVSPSSVPKSKGRIAGPTLPSAADWTEQEEARREFVEYERKNSRKREREEDKERVEDLVGPRETGREAMLEKKRLKRESDRQARGEKDDAFLEVGEDALYGGSDSFQARLAQRDTARKRMEEKRQGERMGRESEGQNRLSALREKDKANMAYLQALAKERFG
ncbi:hypothetical protein M407DRAFT_244066 [Tulasnella calospora MUT 4182]|uniref:Uncharacterized protein n=1 Tax=Tulasnella calospora MUT 4182 TaxID=1051891 RepID=A0A0C3QGJ5_9AGAM|nr:hypothetical protein M407DRAFT_244066 [Tulasnella calospora MUT 4182]